MDMNWAIQMDDQARHLIAIMRDHDDEGIGARAQLDIRIQRIFDLFSCGEVYAAQRMIDYLNDAKKPLIKDNEHNFGGAKEDMSGWTGDAADKFRDYLRDLEDGVRLMIDRIDSMIMILRAHQALVQSMRKDVNELVRHTLDGISAAETNGWKVGAAIVSSVIGVAGAAAAVAGGGIPLTVLGPIAMAMASGALSVAIEADGAHSELGVIVQFVNSGEGMLHLVDVERAKIEDGLRKLADSVTDANLREVRPERPLIVTAPDFRPGTFGLSDQVQGRHRKPKDTRDLVSEPQKHADGRFDQTTKDGHPHDRYAEQGPSA